VSPWRDCVQQVTIILGLWALTSSVALANEAADAAHAYRVDHESQILSGFREFLTLPNVARNPDDMAVNADWLVRRLGGRGFDTQVWKQGGGLYVFGDRKTPGAAATLLIYAHFDGQPVEPANWSSPPWRPTLRSAPVDQGGEVIDWGSVEGAFDPEWRIYARSAGDDKAPPIALMAALDALDDAGIAPAVNIKLILDGEEEIGSPTLGKVLAAHGDSLAADLMLFCDGPMHQSRRRQLVFGVRGGATVDLTTYGAVRPLHSGHYGNWAPNPTDDLVRLLAAMKDEEGNIIVPGYSDGVRSVSDAEAAAIDDIPRVDQALQDTLALGRVEGSGERIERLVMKPAIIVKGFQAGGVGSQARNVIQPSATASLNLRLVPDQTPEMIRPVMERFFQQQGFHFVYDDPGPETLAAHERVLKVDWRSGGYPGFRTALDSPQARRLVAILDSIGGEPTLLTPTMGGSLPIYLFERTLDAPIILLPIANHDNNQHGRDENLRLQNLWDAIEIYAAVIAGYGRD
jgi:acetylornithine deacetylase/succinyl-diaminopimelate desuccinylase-like protein